VQLYEVAVAEPADGLRAREHPAVHLAKAAAAEELALAEPPRGVTGVLQLRVLVLVRAVVQLPRLDHLAVLVAWKEMTRPWTPRS
jgi:hypothetical protein